VYYLSGKVVFLFRLNSYTNL